MKADAMDARAVAVAAYAAAALFLLQRARRRHPLRRVIAAEDVAAQAAALLHQADHNLNAPTLRRHWTRTPSTQAGFTAYLGTMKSKPDNSGN